MDEPADVYIRRYDTNGMAVGGPALVNTYTIGRQQSANVTVLQDASYVVTWSSIDQDGYEFGIYQQLYDPSGAAVGGEVRINITAIGSQISPITSVLEDGSWVVTWSSQDNSTSWDIYQRHFAVQYGDASNENFIGGGADDYLFGRDGNDTLTGGSGGDDILAGGAGDDIYVTDGNETIIEYAGEGADIVRSSVNSTLGTDLEHLVLLGSLAINGTGNNGNNAITGNSAANWLDGGGGTDILVGSLGDDVYVTDGSDTIIENAGSGADIVRSSVSYTIGTNLEHLVLLGTAAINATGNGLENRITGNSGDNTIDGGGGADIMFGAAGSDTYITDGSDTILEVAGGGIDTVQSSVTFVLGPNLERLVLTGTSAINGTGNGLDNTITGNSAANRLNGGSGTDTLVGGLGDDVYVTDGGDTIDENVGEGSDIVRSSVSYALGTNLEHVALQGTAAINAIGNTLSNRLTGNAGSNVLNGLTGFDILLGGAGNDIFAFSTALGPGNVDLVLDFNVADDQILLGSAMFTALSAGALSPDAFVANTTGVAADALDRIIYETDAGTLWYDSDGVGAAAAIRFATLAPSLAVTHADFFVS